METLLPERQQLSLAALAAQSGRSTSELLTEAVDRLLAHEQWFAAQVQIGMDQIARGEFLEEDEMDARVERMLKA
jgi:predicted transcriptional regulator